MSDTKLTALTENTSPTLDDLLYLVNDPSGTPGSQKVKLETLANLFTNNSLYRQALINGNFDVWQRNVTKTNPVNAELIADRWQLQFTNTGTLPTTIIHSQQALTSGDLPGSFYFYRINPNGAGSGFGANDFYRIHQMVEHGTRYLCGAGKKITVSFYARSSIAGKKIGVSALQGYGGGGSPSAAEQMVGQNFTLTSSWVKYSVTLTTNTLSGKTFGTANDDTIQLHFYTMWGTGTHATRVGSDGVAETFVGSGNIDIAQVQLNAGDVALPFMPKSYEEELRACQRFGIAIPSSVAYGFVAAGHANDTTHAILTLALPCEMRKQPTLVATASDWQLSDFANANIDITALELRTANSRPGFVGLYATASGLTQYRPYIMLADNNAARLLFLDAEL